MALLIAPCVILLTGSRVTELTAILTLVHITVLTLVRIAVMTAVRITVITLVCIIPAHVFVVHGGEVTCFPAGITLSLNSTTFARVML